MAARKAGYHCSAGTNCAPRGKIREQISYYPWTLAVACKKSVYLSPGHPQLFGDRISSAYSDFLVLSQPSDYPFLCSGLFPLSFRHSQV